MRVVCIYVRVNTDRMLTNGGCACRWAMGSGVAIMTGREIESVEVAGSLENRYLRSRLTLGQCNYAGLECSDFSSIRRWSVHVVYVRCENVSMRLQPRLTFSTPLIHFILRRRCGIMKLWENAEHEYKHPLRTQGLCHDQFSLAKPYRPPDPSPSLSRSSPTANGQNQRIRESITHPTTMSKKLRHILFMKHTRGRNDDDDEEEEASWAICCVSNWTVCHSNDRQDD